MTRQWQRNVVGVLAVVVAMAPAACAGDDAPSTTTTSAKAATSELKATESDSAISLDAATATAGSIRLTVANTGAVEHELVAFQTDLDEAKLPLAAGRVDEEGAGITHMDPEDEHVMPGGSKTITLDLPAGRYVVLCNLPGHYSLGMHAVLTVQ